MSTNNEKLSLNQNNEKIKNFQEFINEVEKLVDTEIKNSQVNDADLNTKAKVRNGIMNRIWYTLTKQLLEAFKVKITLYYNEKVIFEYEIPRS